MTGAGILYLTPVGVGSHVALYNGSAWQLHTLTEVSLSLTITSGSNYDVFLYDNAGTLTLELSAAWTNNTTRADALALQNGVWVKSGAPTRRFVGTIRASGTNQTEDSRARRFVWNMYHRHPRPMLDQATTDSNVTTNTSWEAYCAETVRVEWVRGLNEDPVCLEARGNAGAAPASNGYVGIGIDTNTANHASLVLGGGGDNLSTPSAFYRSWPSIGYHRADMLQKLQEFTVSITFYGDAAFVDALQAGLSGTVWG